MTNSNFESIMLGLDPDTKLYDSNGDEWGAGELYGVVLQCDGAPELEATFVRDGDGIWELDSHGFRNPTPYVRFFDPSEPK